MNKYLKIFFFGFLVWLIPFLISFLVFSIRESNRALFESIMPLTLTLTIVCFSVIYLKRLKKQFFMESVQIGIIWFIISLVIDLIMFMPETPMQMTFAEYMMDIGLTYLIIPIITIGFGYSIEKR